MEAALFDKSRIRLQYIYLRVGSDNKTILIIFLLLKRKQKKQLKPNKK